jgi:hypothetical protein
VDIRVLGVDWSGDKRAPARKRWVAEVVDGQLVDIRRGDRTEAMVERFVALALEGPLLVGLDFAFSFPEWFVRERIGARDARAVWDAAITDEEGWLEQCQPPFWGRTTKRPPQEEGRPGLRKTEGESPFAAKSVFQIGGAGAVGTGSVRGMPLLASLSAKGFSVWPFDNASERMVIEIYPRILTRGVVKSDHLSRKRYLEQDGRIPPHLLEVAASGEDPFDAAISALEMAHHVDEITALRAEPDYALEGAIWRPGWKPGFSYLDPGLPDEPFVFDHPDGAREGPFERDQTHVASDGTVTVETGGTPRILWIVDFKDGWLVSHDGGGKRWRLRVRPCSEVQSPSPDKGAVLGTGRVRDRHKSSSGLGDGARDAVDARLVGDVARALRAWQASSDRPVATKVLREAVWFFWQNPRLEGPLVSGKYPRSARWSREAATIALGGDGHTRHRLVIEHVAPMHRILRRLIDEQFEVDQVAKMLREGLDVVVVTREQSSALTDEGTPEERYSRAGLNLASFRTLDAWQRSAGP